VAAIACHAPHPARISPSLSPSLSFLGIQSRADRPKWRPAPVLGRRGSPAGSSSRRRWWGCGIKGGWRCAVRRHGEGMELRKIQRRVDGSQAATGSSSPVFFSLQFQTCDPSVCFSSSACLCFCEIQPLPTQICRALILWDQVVPYTDLSCLVLIYGSFFDVLVQVYSRPWHRWFKEQPLIQEGELGIPMLSGLVPFLNIIVSASHILMHFLIHSGCVVEFSKKIVGPRWLERYGIFPCCSYFASLKQSSFMRYDYFGFGSE
jgi:hypothetical protein